MTQLLKKAASPGTWLALIIAANLLIALVTLTDYGESWDEYNFFRYAEQSLAAYPGLFQPGFEPEFSDPTLRHYGAWFLMTSVLVSRLFPNAYISDVAHFLTFMVFQGGIIVFYHLARRWLQPWSALGTTLFYATQPVLWGHAFINARDIPFQTMFMAAIYFGLKFSDSLHAQPPKNNQKLDVSEWAQIARPVRLVLILLLLVGCLIIGLLAFNLYFGWISAAPALADTSDARELDLYLRPILGQFWAGLAFLSLALAWSAFLFLPRLPRLRAQLWQDELHPYVLQVQAVLRSSIFWLAALFLALTVGTRILGAMAAFFIAVHAFARIKRAAFIPITVYGLTALLLMIPTWPYLWGEPLLRLFITLRLMTAFPWPGEVLFNGQYYAGNELPLTYLPTLFSLQLTEPTLLLVGLGFFAALKKHISKEMLLLCVAWFGLPVAAALAGNSYLYDNFRQMLFVLPPLFLLSGLGLQLLWRVISQPWLKTALFAILLLPGLVGIVQMHPYQYIYYNSFVGGATGAFRQYEMDYWGTSFRAVAEYANSNLPEGAEVVVLGPPTTFWRYVRKDIRVFNINEPRQSSGAYYLLITTRNDNDMFTHTEAPTIYQVEKNGAILAVLRYVQP